jgi:transcription termination/antitermination protein NusA
MPRKKVVAVDESQEESGSLSGRLGEFGSAVMQIADEKSIPKDRVMEVVEAALAAAYKKDYGKKGQIIKAKFDEVSKSADFFLVKEVVDDTTRTFYVPKEGEEVEPDHTASQSETGREEEVLEEGELPRFNSERDMILEDAQQYNQEAKLGDLVDIPLPNEEEFGRVAAQTAKQVIIQRIREAERETMYEEYKEKEGQVVNGTVQRIEGRNVFVDLGKSIGILFPSEQMEGETYRQGQHIKVYLVRVESDTKGPGLLLSRSHPEMVRHLFSLEVPEITSGSVEIKAIAREAGSRTKMAVFSDEEGVDPIGSCVGQRGTRVQAIIDELGGEKIDIIEWNEDQEAFITAALAPAKVVKVALFSEEERAEVTVPSDQLSLAIGRRGQNVRLAAKLTGYKLDVVGSEQVKDSDTEREEGVEPDHTASQSETDGEAGEVKDSEPEEVAAPKVGEGVTDPELVEGEK